MSSWAVASFDPADCPTCGCRIDAIRRGLTFDENPSWANHNSPRLAVGERPVAEPCGHTLERYRVKVGEVTYER